MKPPPDEYDEFRDANPDRHAQILRGLIHWAPEPESMLIPKPEPQTVRCIACHEEFEAEAQQAGGGHWLYPNLCSDDCGDVKPEVRRMAEPGKIRSFDCPRCGIRKSIAPVMAGDEWHYFGQCSNCGQRWVNASKLMVKCHSCGKNVPVTSRNREARCKCDGVVRPF